MGSNAKRWIKCCTKSTNRKCLFSLTIHNAECLIREIYFEYLKKPHGIKELIVNTEHIDFVENPEHYNMMIELIDRDYAEGIHTVEDPFNLPYS